MRLLFISFLLFSCTGGNLYTVSRIIDGNSLELSNGVIVTLLGVEKSDENIKVIQHYTNGKIHIYDRNNEEISKFTQSNVSAIIYNSDGDCINDLLRKVNSIIRNVEEPIVEDNIEVKGKTVIKMKPENGIYMIPVEINGVQLNFVFDTGASLISISSDEASNLYNQGLLTNDDILGKSQFVDANGDISEGVIINLTSVKIGNRTLYNIFACVSEGQNSPLLFGQSALEKFGKVTIDYSNHLIIFE